MLGRLPTADERKLGASPVAVVSYAFWRDKLGAPASLDTVHVTLAKPTAVIGVLPNGFDFPDGTQIWLAMEQQPQTPSRTAHNWDVVGRLRAGVRLTTRSAISHRFTRGSLRSTRHSSTAPVRCSFRCSPR